MDTVKGKWKGLRGAGEKPGGRPLESSEQEPGVRLEDTDTKRTEWKAS